MRAGANKGHRVSEGAADALASAAHLPAKVAMAAGILVFCGTGLHRDAGTAEPKELYHEDSAQMHEADHMEQPEDDNRRASAAGAAAGSTVHAEIHPGAPESLLTPGISEWQSTGQQEQQQMQMAKEAAECGSNTAELKSCASVHSSAPPMSIDLEVQAYNKLLYVVQDSTI